MPAAELWHGDTVHSLMSLTQGTHYNVRAPDTSVISIEVTAGKVTGS